MATCNTNYICADLLYLILTRLPVKTLLRCRSVSKSWKETIDSASFALDHLANQTPRVLLQNSSPEIHLLDPNYHPLYDTISTPTEKDFRSSFNAFTAFSTIHGVICLYDEGDKLFLWNPSIRRHMRIPMVMDDDDPSSDVAFYDEGYKFCGFWMDPCTKEFKVVIFHVDEDDDFTFGCLFSSRHPKWRKQETAAFSGDGLPGMTSLVDLLIDGVVYWLVGDDYQDRPDEFSYSIIHYDFGMERLGKISLGEEMRARNMVCHRISFCKWDCSGSGTGSSCLSVVIAPIDKAEFEIWALTGESWSKMVHVVGPIDQDLHTFFTVLDRYNALAFNTNLDLVLYAKDGDEDEGLLTRFGSRNGANIPLKFPRLAFRLNFVQSLIFPHPIKSNAILYIVGSQS